MAMMTISNNNLSRFSRYLWLTLGLFIIISDRNAARNILRRGRATLAVGIPVL